MAWKDKLTEWVRHAFFYGDNWMTILGGILTTGAGFTLLWSWFRELASPHSALPYVGLILFVALPVLFLIGLLLMPAGMLLKRRRLLKTDKNPRIMPKVDLTTTHIRNVLVFVVLATGLNIALLGVATVRGVEYMDSSKFCGLTCHTPMIMEYRAFSDSPHSRVGCAQCHIGPGADSFMRAKLAGVRQLFGVVFNNYSRPIPSPVESLRPAKETCEACHWPQKFHGDKIIVRTHYGDDAANTPSITVLMLKIGGRTGEVNTGIHGRHIDASERISYVATDRRRQEIAKVTYRDDQGHQVEYFADTKARPEDLAKAPERKMDCVDCHNRPTHAFESPEWAMDRRITEGGVSRDLPFIHKKGVEVLKVPYRTQDEGAAAIVKAIQDYYQATYPAIFKDRRAQVDAAANAVKEAYLRNVYPEMKLTWGTHPNQIGHHEGGCFRCHDGSHSTKDGKKTIASDCDTCHTILAQDDPDPKILKELGTK